MSNGVFLQFQIAHVCNRVFISIDIHQKIKINNILQITGIEKDKEETISHTLYMLWKSFM